MIFALLASSRFQSLCGQGFISLGTCEKSPAVLKTLRYPHSDMSEPVVSVLLPVRDAGPYLKECIASLERQTLEEYEVVAVDDGSTDGSANTLDEWAAGDDRVRVVHRSESGLVETLNVGLELCTAPFVARMDADDISHPKRFELQVAEFDELPWVGVVSSLVRHFPWHGVGEGYRVYEEWLNSLLTPEQISRERFVESPVPHPSAMVRREVFESAGGYRDENWAEDFDLWLRLFEAGVTFTKVEKYLYFWREHAERLTRVDSRYSVENFLRCKAKYLLSGPLAGRQCVVIWGAGQTGRRISKFLLREGAPVEAFVDIDPEKIGSTLREKPIISFDELRAMMGPGTVVLAAVGSRGARDLIRGQLNNIGLREGLNYWCVA
jgi:glycosyltransferase involved in cell wall biosynthesis